VALGRARELARDLPQHNTRSKRVTPVLTLGTSL
jgi:hypothetical protein